MIACLVTCTNADTGYSLYDLLVTVYDAKGWNRNAIPLKVASLTISYLGTSDGYIVPYNGDYSASATAHVPDHYGFDFVNQGQMFDKHMVGNHMSLTEINLGVQTAGEKFAILAFAD